MPTNQSFKEDDTRTETGTVSENRTSKDMRSESGGSSSDTDSAPIPHVIHYCWFGGKPVPRSARKCIDSWKEYFPGWEIKQWNESNYDVWKIPYIAQAYDAKKYAFVSDYARFDILYQYGGVYFDTDVEVIKPFDDILARGAFMGLEQGGGKREASENRKQGIEAVCVVSSVSKEEIDSETEPSTGEDKKGAVSLETGRICADGEAGRANPGLGIAAAPGLGMYREILDYYGKHPFYLQDGRINPEAVVRITTKFLLKYGMKDVGGIQRVGEVTVYPPEYFNPLNSVTGELVITEKTHSIHRYTASWLSPGRRLKLKIGRWVRGLFGAEFFKRGNNSV